MSDNIKKNKNNQKSKEGLGIVIFMVISMLIPIGYVMLRETSTPSTPSAVTKNITIEIINSAEESTSYPVTTDAEYLRQAMEEAEGLEFSGTEGDYGIMLTTVNGEIASYDENGAYWSITVDGEYGNYGIDQQPITDGATYQIIYTLSE